MYESTNLGDFGGLLGVWKKSTMPAKVIARIEAHIKGLPAKAEGLPAPVVDPDVFIPKTHKILNAKQAMQLVSRPPRAGGKKKKGQVYWTAQGPKYSERQITGGGIAESVPAPVIKLHPRTKIIKDLPSVKLPPAPALTSPPSAPPAPPSKPSAALQGLGEAVASNWGSIFVLGLLFLLICRYNKS